MKALLVGAWTCAPYTPNTNTHIDALTLKVGTTVTSGGPWKAK